MSTWCIIIRSNWSWIQSVVCSFIIKNSCSFANSVWNHANARFSWLFGDFLLVKSYQPTRALLRTRILPLMLLTGCTTWVVTCRCEPTGEHAASTSVPLSCIYLQAVPCDPAGADFNFAALSFNSKFLHQIHLVPLHPHSVWEAQRTFTGSETDANRGLEGRNQSDPYHNFPSRPPGDVVRLTTVAPVSPSPAQPTLPPSLPPSHTKSLIYWCALIWRVNRE